MNKTNARHSTPSPRTVTTKREEVGADRSPSSVFFGLVMDMSWRLAVVVLIPVVGGFKLDSHLHTAPLLTIIGFAIAILGMVLVLRQMLSQVAQLPIPKKETQT